MFFLFSAGTDHTGRHFFQIKIFNIMAIVQNPLIGQTKGKVGNVVFYKSFSNNIIRSKPIQVANPRTPGQVSARSMFKLCQSFIAKNLLLFRDTCQFLIDNNSAYIACIKYYMNQVAIKENDLYKFDLEKMIFSSGELTNIAAPTLCQIDANFDISIEWNDNTGTGSAAADDIINFILYNVTTDTVKRFEATRQIAEIQIFQNENGISENNDYQLFYFASNADQNQFSNTAPATLTTSQPEPQALEITWDNIANAPARTLEAWNTFFDLPTNGTAFTSYEEVANVIKLYGGEGITIIENTLYLNNNIISIIDNSNSITIIESYNLSICPILSEIKFPVLHQVYDDVFNDSQNLVTINIPSIINLGSTPDEGMIFSMVSGKSVNLTIPHSILSNFHIINLLANNTVTLIYSD